MIAFFNGRYVPKGEVAISPDDRGFLFADGLYEVVRLYNGRPFRPAEHFARLARGARELRFEQTSFDELSGVLDELIRRNSLHDADAMVYFQVTRGAGPRSHAFPPKDTPLTVYAVPMPLSCSLEEEPAGVRAILVPDQRWSRCDIKAVGLLPNTLAHQQAREAGAQEAIFVRGRLVQEGTRSNVFIVSGGVVGTPPLTNYVLPGITRQAVLDLCAELSLSCRQDPIGRSDVLAADEVMIVGTGSEISPVVAIDGRKIGNGQPGPVTGRLQAAFSAMTGPSAAAGLGGG